MQLLQDVITYIRRIVKTANNDQLSDNLIIDYINRFWINDVDARLQLFDLKTKYQFQTQPGVDQYNMPLYSNQTQPGNQVIGMYPVYQGFLGPAYIKGLQVPFYTLKSTFTSIFPNVQNNVIVGYGDGTTGPYNLNFNIGNYNTTPVNPPLQAIVRGHVDISGIIAYSNAFGGNQDPILVSNAAISGNQAFIQTVPTTSINSGVFISTVDSTGANMIIADSGQFLESNINFGLLMEVGNAPLGNLPLTGGPAPNYSVTQNTVNYLNGSVTGLYFPRAVPAGVAITAQYTFLACGYSRAILFFNNTLTLRMPPDRQYLVELDAYLTPAAFLNTSQALPFGYMAEYIARGAARKILSDTGDVEQFNFYEPLFREQEMLVWKRSQRQFTATRTPTIYAQDQNVTGINGTYMGISGY